MNKCTNPVVTFNLLFLKVRLTKLQCAEHVQTHAVWFELCCGLFCQSPVGHWRESPLKMEHAWSQGWATECSKCLSLGLGETWPPGQRLSSQRRLCAYQHHSSYWPRNLLTMQRRPFSPRATSAQDCWSSWQNLLNSAFLDNEGSPKTRLEKWGKRLNANAKYISLQFV